MSVTLEGETVEVTTFRVDGTYHDHRRPDQVTFTRSLEEDLCRRDFTINAMALNLRGELRDPFCGQSDLAAGVLRCVGEPERRFEEDALRILRGMRFASVLGLRVEEATAMGIHRCAPLLAQIAPFNERATGDAWILMPFGVISICAALSTQNTLLSVRRS